MTTVKAGVASDEKSAALLERISAAFKSYGNYEVQFTVSADGMDDMSGYYLVSGDKYRISIPGGEHLSDGTVRYEISHDNKEVIIDNADLGSSNLFTNPSRAFEFAGDQFESRWLRSETISGIECDVVSLLPLSRAYGNMAVTLYVDSASGLPTAVIYDYDGQTISIAITGIKRLDSADPLAFVFNRADYADYEVIDFR